jgi:CheY-like chemotaxis protein
MTTNTNILIVDDSVTTRSLIRRIIHQSGMQTWLLLEAANGQEALEALQRQPVGLVLADLNMPVMDGLQMIAEMRSRPHLRDTLVVVISALPDTDATEKLRRLGVTHYLSKPFTPERVRDVIDSARRGGIMQVVNAVTPVHRPGESLERILARSLTEALQVMALMSTDIPRELELDRSPELKRSRVDFNSQDWKGSLTLTASKQFGEAIAGNCAVNDAFNNAEDALKELTNVACGLFLRSRPGGSSGIKLEPPVIENGGSLVPRSNRVTVLADGFMVSAELIAA